ncbi:hypothetical protein E2562_014511 [Oryza meyeriana var. granulata]|uniref:Uncharacterized protein n=1 Tax=Oryza meyeriana var. granulata TaxID=110450 RepID=A0A6G1EJE3_9ORYZ|nr:hypothetical protein E2562_014511 [Oryza meyeriana var. granulata]
MAGTPEARWLSYQARFYPMCMSPPPPGQLLSDHLQLLLLMKRSKVKLIRMSAEGFDVVQLNC